jgi:hypothetical protein
MYSLNHDPEADLKTCQISKEALGMALDKERSEKHLYERRIEELEDRLINKYNDKDTAKSIFNAPDPNSWAAFQDRHPGISQMILEGMYHDHIKWIEEIEKEKSF